MMISLTDLLMVINTLFIVGLCVHYFKSHYTIIDMETYNQVADICEEYTAMIQEKEQLDDGGEGFFRECLEEVEEDDEDFEEEEEEDKKEEKPKKKRGRKAKEENKKVGF